MARPKGAKGKGKAPSKASAKSKPATLSSQNDVLPSIEPPGTPLQETSGNRLKRTRDTLDKDSDPYENTPSPKRTPTPTIFTGREYRTFREKHPIRPWKERRVTGQYTLLSCRSDSGHHVDTTGFEVKVFYDCSGEERNLYATFKFDKLEGIIRPRRHLNYEDETRRLTAAEYDEACNLPSKDWPSRGCCEYSSRWRGKECGERIIDGELGHVFELIAQKTTSSNGFPDMKLLFDILYDDEVFHMKAVKTADLDSSDLERTYTLEEEWQALYDLRPEAKFKVKFEKQGECWYERMRIFPENRKRKAEYHPFSNGSRETSNMPLKCLRSITASSKAKTIPWSVSGRYWLYCTNRLDPVDADDYCFELHITQPVAQLFATFEFGNIKGLMRLCPEQALTSRLDKSLSGAAFENACNLDEKTRPGPTSMSWLVRIFP
ncbi:hypothetical protein N431DRAFT_355698 [Stipitochalara longipes BDJ]|nr:hypothetical protein N431DRAFT_355698 [Stipitochalara longipes BDJ]